MIKTKVTFGLIIFVSFSAVFVSSTTTKNESETNNDVAVLVNTTTDYIPSYRHMSSFAVTTGENASEVTKCAAANSSIDQFPEDLFTDTQRKHGALILHLLGAIYFFTLLAVVCNDYFLPSVQCICEDLNISKDVAAATFMATATTAPEFFTNVISTFLMESDMGLGTIIGSMTFNTLGVAAVASLATVQPVKLDAWPITRDCILFIINLSFLTIFAWDSRITLPESIFMVILYFIYFIVLFQNKRILIVVNMVMKYFNRNSFDIPSSYPEQDTYTKASINSLDFEAKSNKPPIEPIYVIYKTQDSKSSMISKSSESSLDEKGKKKNRKSLWRVPLGAHLRVLWWVYTWPIKFLLTFTIPNPKTWRKLYPATFLLCIMWIGVNAYMIVWMITIMGFTLSVPETVMGLTFLAAGGCMPEAISSCLAIRKGEGGFGVSNSLGANSMAILMSLGFPWLVRNIIYINKGRDPFITIQSDGIEFTIMSLVLATIALYIVISIAKYQLRKCVGIVLIFIYLFFITMGILIEMDIIFPPTERCM